MSSTVKYHLKQETPMWHFQYRDSGIQEGATLRGSDVKPRLDQFLINMMKAENVDWEPFKLSADHDALNYKIQITACGEATVDKDAKYKAFFANMGPRVDKEFTVLFKEGVELKIVCFIPELMDVIQKHISAFFLINNFGTRQDKGFGSFVVDKIDGNPVTTNNVPQILKGYSSVGGYTVYSIDVSGCTDTNVLDNAYVLYQWMKSGINFGRTYKKSLLIEYMLDKDVGSEKRYMKEKDIAPKIQSGPGGSKVADTRRPPAPVADMRYVRAVLGVSGTQSWFTDKTTIVNGKERYIKEDIVVSSSEIERFQSPITIKLIRNRLFFIVYALSVDPDNTIFDRDFSFGNKATGKTGKLKTVSGFDIVDFMNYCISNVNGISFDLGFDRDRNQPIKYKYAINIV